MEQPAEVIVRISSTANDCADLRARLASVLPRDWVPQDDAEHKLCSERARGSSRATCCNAFRLNIVDGEVEKTVKRVASALRLRKAVLLAILPNAVFECIIRVLGGSYSGFVLSPDLSTEVADSGLDILIVRRRPNAGVPATG